MSFVQEKILFFLSAQNFLKVHFWFYPIPRPPFKKIQTMESSVRFPDLHRITLTEKKRKKQFNKNVQTQASSAALDTFSSPWEDFHGSHKSWKWIHWLKWNDRLWRGRCYPSLGSGFFRPPIGRCVCTCTYTHPHSVPGSGINWQTLTLPKATEDSTYRHTSRLPSVCKGPTSTGGCWAMDAALPGWWLRGSLMGFRIFFFEGEPKPAAPGEVSRTPSIPGPLRWGELKPGDSFWAVVLKCSL